MEIRLPDLLWYQKPVVKAMEDSRHKFIAVNFSRRIGKTMLCLGQAVKWATTERCNIGYIVPSGDLARKLIRRLVEDIRPVISHSNSVDKYVQFTNGSIIYWLSIEGWARGAGNFKYMFVDEAAWMGTDVWESVFRPMTLESKKVIFVSTPNGVGGVFYDMFNQGLTGDKRHISFSCTLEESGLYPENDVQEIKESTPEQIWLQEYCCEFINGGISAFKGFEERLRKEPVTEYKRLYGGVDVSGVNGEDSTVLTIVNEKGEQVYCKTWQNGTIAVLNEIGDTLNLMNVRQTWIEQNGVGQVAVDIIKQRCKRVTGFYTTNDTKRDIVEFVIRMFEKKEGSIIDTPQARLQFGQFVMLRTKQGKITYRALKDNDHDDLPMSHCLACGAMKMYERKAKRVLT